MSLPPGAAPVSAADCVAVLEAALDELETYFDGRSDVVDGDYGVPAPNEEMILRQTVREAQAALRSIRALQQEGEPVVWEVSSWTGDNRKPLRVLFKDKADADEYFAWREGSCNKPTLIPLYALTPSPKGPTT
jgi:hypothetical protein